RRLVTVKLLNGADVPTEFVTITLRGPTITLALIVTVMGRVVAVPPLPIVAVTPLPLKVTAVAPPRFSPLIVAGKLVPATPEDGVIPVIIGPGVTVKLLNSADVPAEVVTVTPRGPSAALRPIATVTGRPVAVPPLPIVAVTPVPVNVTAVAPSRFVPVIVAPTVMPRPPVSGIIAAIS